MRIEGYEFEITEFDSCAEANAAYLTARLEDKPIYGGNVVCLAVSPRIVYGVKISGETEYWL